MARKFGVSVISMLPYSLGPNGLGRSVEIAVNAGMDGVQALPLYGWNPKLFPERGVLSIEEAWGQGSNYSQHSVRNYLLFDREYRSFYLYNKLYAKYPYAIRSMHGVYTDPVEIHPELKISEEGYLRAGFPIVFDTLHVRRIGANGEPPVTTDPLRFISLLGKRIQLIHLRLSHEEEKSLLKQEETSEIVKVAKSLNNYTKCNVILELVPKIQSKTQLIKRLRGLYLASNRYLH
jgi:hypothetical protein